MSKRRTNQELQAELARLKADLASLRMWSGSVSFSLSASEVNDLAQQDKQPWEKSLGSVYGYRRFMVDEKGRLRPWVTNYQSHIWTPGENVARCLATMPDFTAYLTTTTTAIQTAHRAPAPGCHCGFYARYVYDRDVFDDTWAEPRGLLGVIEGYGRTEIGTKGFRCEKAMVREVWLPGRKQHMRDRLQHLYPEVLIHDTIAALLDSHPEFGMPERLEELPVDFWTKP